MFISQYDPVLYDLMMENTWNGLVGTPNLDAWVDRYGWLCDNQKKHWYTLAGGLGGSICACPCCGFARSDMWSAATVLPPHCTPLKLSSLAFTCCTQPGACCTYVLPSPLPCVFSVVLVDHMLVSRLNGSSQRSVYACPTAQHGTSSSIFAMRPDLDMRDVSTHSHTLG